MGKGIGIDFGSGGSRVAVDDGTGPRLLFSLDPEGRRLVTTVDHSRQKAAGEEEDIPCYRCLQVETLKTILGRPRPAHEHHAKAWDQADHDAASHFRRIKSELERRLQARVTAVTVAAPSIYSMSQRAALRTAVQAGGFGTVSLLDEPLAAALATFPLSKPAGQVLVFALGRSLFSASAISMTENGVEGLAHEGMAHLGGDALDAQIIGRLVADFNATRGVLVCKDPSALKELQERAETARLALATAERAEIEVGPGRDASGRTFHAVYQLQRQQMEDMLAPLVGRMMEFTQQALREAQWEPGTLNRVLTVGAAAQTPLVQERLAELTACELTPAAPEAVAIGAARYSSNMLDCWRPFTAEELAEVQAAEREAAAPAAPPPAESPRVSAPPPAAAESASEAEEDEILTALLHVRKAVAAHQPDRALVAYEELLRRARLELSFLYSRRGAELREEGLLPEAEARFTRARQHNPESDHIRRSLADVHAIQAVAHARARQWRECKRHLRDCLHYDPENSLGLQLKHELADSTPRGSGGRKGKRP